MPEQRNLIMAIVLSVTIIIAFQYFYELPRIKDAKQQEVVRTEHRSVVGWADILPVPWHLLDIEPYREHQMRASSHKDILRMPTPPAIGESVVLPAPTF